MWEERMKWQLYFSMIICNWSSLSSSVLMGCRMKGLRLQWWYSVEMLRCLHIYRQLGIIWSEWGVTFKCECWCWCHRVKVVELDNCKLCAYLLPFSQRVRCRVMFISNPPALIWRKFLALLSGEVVRFLHPTSGGNVSCLELMGLVKREGCRGGLKVDGNMKKQII